MEQIEYYVNEEKGVIVAKIYNVKMALYNEFSSFYNTSGETKYEFAPELYILNNGVNKWFINTKKEDYVIGMAKCNFEDGDIFNIEFGKNLARARALKKLNDVKMSFFNFLIGDILNMIKDYQNKLSIFETLKIKKISEIENLISPQN